MGIIGTAPLSSLALASCIWTPCGYDANSKTRLCSAHDRWDEAHGFLRFGTEKIKVATLIRLKDVINVEPGVTAQMFAHLRSPLRQAFYHLWLRDQQVQTPLRDAQPDPVTISHDCQRSSNCGLRRSVKDHRPIACTAHPRITNSDYVSHTLFQQFDGNRNFRPLRHSRNASRTRVPHHEDTFRRNIQIFGINSGQHLLIAVEDNGGSRMVQQSLSGGGRL